MGKFVMQTSPRNGKMAAMIDEAVTSVLNQWNEAAEEAARTIVGRVDASRVTRDARSDGRGPELRLFVDGRCVFQMRWVWDGLVGTLKQEWSDGWRDA